MGRYEWFLSTGSVEEAAEVLRRSGTHGVVLPGNERWTPLLLPRSDHDRERIMTLAAHHPAGVVLVDRGPAGHRTWHVRDTLEALDDDQGLQLPTVAVNPHALTVGRVDVAGAVAVGLDVVVPQPPQPAVLPADGTALFGTLCRTGALVVQGDEEGLAEGFQARWAAGATAADLNAWLLQQPQVEELYVSDEALQRILDGMPRHDG